MLPTFDPWLSAVAAADVAACTFAPADVLASVRARRLGALLRASARDSPLYQKILGGRDLDAVQLHELPVMTRAELMHSFSRWVGDPQIRLDALRRFTAERRMIAEPFLDRYTVWESSGSSGGEPGVFVQDAAALAVYDALEAVRRTMLRPSGRVVDPLYLGERIAFVGAMSGHFATAVTVQRLRQLNPLLATRLHPVSVLQPLAAIAAQLEALRPTIIATYPSAALLLAEERRGGRLDITPREIWTGGETLTGTMRAFVERAFECPVINSYGASEFLTLASQCTHGSMHLNVDWVILESIDRNGRPVPHGTPGASVLLTNLANHVQPLIRYDLTDSVTVHASSCTCGSSLPVIEIQGRRDDILRIAADDERVASILPLAVTTVLEDEAGLFNFQLIQTGPSELLLRTGLRGRRATDALKRAKAVLSAYLAAQGATSTHIHCRAGEPAEPSRSGKVRRVIARQHSV